MLNDKPLERRGRGRPPGRTVQGHVARTRLYEEAIRLIGSRGYAEATLRDIARSARVSPALLYRYFPSKRAVVLALYDDLSAQYAERAQSMAPGTWRERFLFALRTSLDVLRPHRTVLAGLVPILVGDADDGVLAPSKAFSRRRVQAAFEAAVSGARDAPAREGALALGRLLYLIHLAVLLGWLLDRSPQQRATAGLLALLKRAMPAVALALRFPRMRALARAADGLLREGWLSEPAN
jgi:AcrR family transcriptional regulator